MTARIRAIDVIRGAVMILMAIDHVRVYSGLPAGGPEPAIFFTRWITHFCAPAFIFFAGTSAFLGRATPRLLWTRGAWLILLELTVIRFAWTFNFDYLHYVLAGVLWVIGWSMIVLAALVKLKVRTVGIIGVAIIVLHNAVGMPLAGLLPGPLARILYIGFFEGPVGPLTVLYALVPWVGVMAAGYAFGAIVRRHDLCLTIGLGAVAAFLVLRGFNLYGDPRPWSGNLLSFLNTAKYPASLLFLLMTLGPVIASIPLLERARGPVADAIAVFGRVPFFYYLLHLPLIHLLALAVRYDPWLFANHPMENPPPPDGYTWSLPLLYAVFAVAVILLYFPCRWFAGVKARRKDWWLGYL